MWAEEGSMVRVGARRSVVLGIRQIWVQILDLPLPVYVSLWVLEIVTNPILKTTL